MLKLGSWGLRVQMRKIILLSPSRMGTYNTKEIFSNSGQWERAADEIGQAPLNNTEKTNSIYFPLVLISILVL